MSELFIFGCVSRQISARFRETWFQFRVRTCVCHDASSAHDVTFRRDATRSDIPRGLPIRKRIHACSHDTPLVHICVQTRLHSDCGLGYRPYFNLTLLASLQNRVLDATWITARFLIVVRFNLTDWIELFERDVHIDFTFMGNLYVGFIFIQNSK